MSVETERLYEAQRIAREQRDPDSEVYVLFEHETAGEGLLVQEIERLHAALGVTDDSPYGESPRDA